MSINYLNLVFSVALNGVKKSVLLALADRANNGGFCYPSLEDIAFRSGCSKRTVIRAINDLEKLDFLIVVRGLGQVNKYILLPDKLYTTRDTVTLQKDNHNGVTLTRESDTVSKKRCHDDTLTIINHHLTKEKRARGNEKNFNVPFHKPNKQIIGHELKQMRDILIAVGGDK